MFSLTVTVSGLLKAAAKVLPAFVLVSVISFPAWGDIIAIAGSVYLVVPWAQERDWEDRGPAIPGASWESVEFPGSRDVRISAWWVHPLQDKGTIILAHGSHSDRRSMLYMAGLLHEAGYGSLLVDLTAYGRSGGRVSSLGLWEGDDVAAAAAFLKGRGENSIGAMGTSLGAVAVIFGAARSQDIQAVVADSPYANLGELLRHWGRGRDVVVGFLFQRLVGVEVDQVSPAATVSKISPRPVFIIGGEEDASIPASHFDQVYKAAGEPKELWVTPDAPHVGALSTQPEQYKVRITGFFDTYLRR